MSLSVLHRGNGIYLTRPGDAQLEARRRIAVRYVSDMPGLDGLRVLQVGPLYSSHVRRWTEHAAALGCRVCVAGHVRPGRRPVELGHLAVRVEILPETLIRSGSARWAAWLHEVVRGWQPDLVHPHWLSTWGCFATFSNHPNVVLTPWGSDVYLAAGGARAQGDLALSRAKRVLARSWHMRDELIARGASPERIEHVDLGVDLQRFHPAQAPERARARDKLGLGPGPVILSMRDGPSLTYAFAAGELDDSPAASASLAS